MKILICGDSFAADWTVKYPGRGWPNMLAEQHEVVNLAQAGCGEYKILKQLESADLNMYDQIIVSHTSPYRIYVKTHPVHVNDPLHKNSDLIYTDIKEHSKSNKKLLPIVEFFENYFDTESAEFTHTLICREIDQLLQSYKTIHISNLIWNNNYKFNNMLNFEYLFKSNRGLMNHYNDAGNQEVFRILSTTLNRKYHG
jgi:hypothetical protein